MESYSSQISAETKPDYLFKIILFGESLTGKTSILQKYIDGYYKEESHILIGVDFRIKLVKVEDKIAKLQIWDFHRVERFRPITSAYYRGAHGILVVYDISNRSSFEALPKITDSIQQHASKDCKWILLGNKADKEESRAVDFAEGSALASKFGVPFFETSAKTGFGITDAFDLLVAQMKKQNDSIDKRALFLEHIQQLKKEYQTDKKIPSCC